MQIDKTNAIEKKEHIRNTDLTAFSSPPTQSQAQNAQAALSSSSTQLTPSASSLPLQPQEDQQQQLEGDFDLTYCMTAPPAGEFINKNNKNEDRTPCQQQQSELGREEAQLQIDLQNVVVAESPPKILTTNTTTNKNSAQDSDLFRAGYSQRRVIFAKNFETAAVPAATSSQETYYDDCAALLCYPPIKSASTASQGASPSSSTSAPTVRKRKIASVSSASSLYSSIGSSSTSIPVKASDFDSDFDYGSRLNQQESIELSDDSEDNCFLTKLVTEAPLNEQKSTDLRHIYQKSNGLEQPSAVNACDIDNASPPIAIGLYQTHWAAPQLPTIPKPSLLQSPLAELQTEAPGVNALELPLEQIIRFYNNESLRRSALAQGSDTSPVEWQPTQPGEQLQQKEAAVPVEPTTVQLAWPSDPEQPTQSQYPGTNSFITDVLSELESRLLKERSSVDDRDVAWLPVSEAETVDLQAVEPDISVNEESCKPTTPKSVPESKSAQREFPSQTQKIKVNLNENLRLLLTQQRQRVLRETEFYLELVKYSRTQQLSASRATILSEFLNSIFGAKPSSPRDSSSADPRLDYQYCNGVAGSRDLDAAGMGLDNFLHKIIKFFNYGLSSNSHDIGEQEEGNNVNILRVRKSRENLKRQSQSNQSHPIAFKYQRVDNTFPRIITPAHLTDRGNYDDDCILTGIAYNNPMNSESNLQQNSSPSFPHMAAANSAKSKQRRSVFDEPHSTRRVFRVSGPVTEIDLSDDDDENNDLYAEIVERKVRSVSDMGIPASGGLNTLKQQRQHHQQSSVEFDLPPPPLLVVRDGDWMSAYRRKIHVAGNTTPPPLHHGGLNTAHFLRASSSLSSQDVSSVGSLHLNGSGSGGGGTSLWHTAQHQMLNKEREMDEHAQYLSLLKQFVPCVYDSDDTRPAQPTVSTYAGDQRYGLSLGKNKPLANSSLLSQQQRHRLPSRRPLNAIVQHDDDDVVNETTPLTDYVINVDDDDDNVRDGNEDIIDLNIVPRADIACSTLYNSSKSSAHGSYRETQKMRDGQLNHVEIISTVDLIDDGDEEYGNDHDSIRNDFKDVVDLSGFDENEAGAEGGNVVGNLANKSWNNVQMKTSLKDAPKVTSVNSLEHQLRACAVMQPEWEINVSAKWSRLSEERRKDSNFWQEKVKLLEAERVKRDQEVLARRLSRIELLEHPFIDLDDLEPQVASVPEELMSLSEQQKSQLQMVISKPQNKVLISKFNLNITRADINSLIGLHWLNDEVINFYMSLLTERSEQRKDLPRVYAMNTFFVQKLLQGGHASLKRWTRKVDLFAMDVIPVPVHVGGVHWCMAVIHMKEKSIRYYDSMGKANPAVLRALELYLQHESLDKRNIPFDTSDFLVESVADSPHQANGSDCGVFSCMTAEYITRGKPITFSQANMEYFRQKMILEIVGGQLWH